MAETITQEFYNGKEWIRVTAVKQINENSDPTGHFTEIDREYINKFGIFDDFDTLQDFIKAVKNFKIETKDSYYIARSDNNIYYQVFSTYALTPKYEHLGSAVIDFLKSTNLIPQGYSVNPPSEDNNWNANISIELYDRQTKEPINIIITAGSKLIYTIGG
jgi:hypothetical protein